MIFSISEVGRLEGNAVPNQWLLCPRWWWENQPNSTSPMLAMYVHVVCSKQNCSEAIPVWCMFCSVPFRSKLCILVVWCKVTFDNAFRFHSNPNISFFSQISVLTYFVPSACFVDRLIFAIRVTVQLYTVHTIRIRTACLVLPQQLRLGVRKRWRRTGCQVCQGNHHSRL